MAPNPWTAQRVAQLKDCVDRKMSGGRTAEIMGMTRGQVVGAATRRGWSFASVKGPAFQKPQGNQGWRLPRPTPVIEQPLPETAHEYLMIPLRDLPENGCRFIPGDDRLYCGQPQHCDSSYCKHCGWLMYRVIPRPGPMNLKVWQR